MHYVNPVKAGLTCGAFLGGWHVLWALLVALGWAQAIYDFVLWAHMISLPLVIKPFDATAAGTLIILTAAIGYVLGSVFAILWNRMHRD